MRVERWRDDRAIGSTKDRYARATSENGVNTREREDSAVRQRVRAGLAERGRQIETTRREARDAFRGERDSWQ